MRKEVILGIVRHLLTFAGGILVVKGYVDETLVQEVVGGVISLVATVWSIFSKQPKAE